MYTILCLFFPLFLFFFFLCCSQSYSLFTAGVGEMLELSSCLHVIGGCDHVTVEQFQSSMTQAATSHERVVLTLVQDGKEK